MLRPILTEHFRLILAILSIYLSIVTLLGTLNPVTAQSIAEGWTEPQLLFEDRDGFSRLDYMVADPSGAVHLFWSSNPRSPYTDGNAFDISETVIFYQQFSQDDWSISRDILLSKQASLPFGAVVDASGTLHIVTAVGGPPCLAYMSVPVLQAGNPHIWPQPLCLEPIGVGSPDLALSGDTLYVIYPAASQKEIAFIRSVNGGQTWSPPIPIETIYSDEINLGFPRIVADGDNRLHAIWGEVAAPGGYPFVRLMHARSLDGGDSWSTPLELADGHQGDPNLAVFGDTVHAVWNGDAGYQGRYYRVSHDAGLTWSDRVTLPLPITSGGLQGAPAIIVDNAGTAHILYTDSPRLYYITNQNGVWSQPIQIAGPENTDSVSEINYPILAITEGNELHALYTRDAQAVYYQHRIIDAPHQPTQPFILPAEPTPIMVASPTVMPEEPTPVPTWSTTETAPAPSSSGVLNLMFSILPAILLVGGVLIIYSMGARR